MANNKNKKNNSGIKFESTEKKKGNAIDLLLATDNSKFCRPRKKIKMERLSEIIGKDFIVEIEELLPTESESIFQTCSKINPSTEEVEFNLRKLHNMTIVAATLYEGASLFKNEDLKAKFGSRNPHELLEKLTTIKEREKLYKMIENLGSSKDMFTEVKN